MALDADRSTAGSEAGSRSSLLAVLTLLFAVVGPIASIAGLTPQVARTGNVSHWPWEEYGVLGWWLVPASLWIAVACDRARLGSGLQGRTTRLLLLLAVGTTLALLYNP